VLIARNLLWDSGAVRRRRVMASRAYAERQAGREERNKTRCPITDTASRPLRGLAISLASATGPSKLCQHPNPIYFLFQSSSVVPALSCMLPNRGSIFNEPS